MNTGKFNNWLQIAANLGILIGLILVGFQMRQNSELLRAELAFMESQRLIDGAQALAGENPSSVFAKHLTNLEDLSLQEQIEIEAFYYTHFENWRSMHILASIGILEDEWKIRIDNDAQWLLGNPYGRARWESAQNFQPQEVVDYVNNLLERKPIGPDATTRRYYESIFNNALRYKEESQN